MNKFIITGKVLTNPELQETKSGLRFCKIRVKQGANLIDLTYWKEQAEKVAEQVVVGALGAFEGSLSGKENDKGFVNINLSGYSFEIFSEPEPSKATTLTGKEEVGKDPLAAEDGDEIL